MWYGVYAGSVHEVWDERHKQIGTDWAWRANRTWIAVTDMNGSNGLDTEAVVIGAGPYGLSVSAHLSSLGVRHEIFGKTMELWARHMPKGMYLKSEGFASNLADPSGEHTLERFCAEHGHEYEYRKIGAPIPLDTFERYGRWFQERLVPSVRDERVAHIQRVPEGFDLKLDTGEGLRAKSIVVATGMTNHAYLPQILCGLPSDAMLHSYDYHDPACSRGAEIAVIGAGQSALEAAALAHEQGATVRLIVRAAQVLWNTKPGGSDRSLWRRLRYPESGLGEGGSQWVYSNLPLAFHFAPERKRKHWAYTTALGPAGAWWLRQRIEGQFELLLSRTIVAAQPTDNGRVRLQLQGPSGVEHVEADMVVAGTGYRPHVSQLGFLDQDLCDNIANLSGTPVLDAAFQSSVSDLYFVGYLAGLGFGPLMRFVFGTDFAARRVAQRLAG